MRGKPIFLVCLIFLIALNSCPSQSVAQNSGPFYQQIFDKAKYWGVDTGFSHNELIDLLKYRLTPIPFRPTTTPTTTRTPVWNYGATNTPTETSQPDPTATPFFGAHCGDAKAASLTTTLEGVIPEVGYPGNDYQTGCAWLNDANDGVVRFDITEKGVFTVEGANAYVTGPFSMSIVSDCQDIAGTELLCVREHQTVGMTINPGPWYGIIKRGEQSGDVKFDINFVPNSPTPTGTLPTSTPSPTMTPTLTATNTPVAAATISESGIFVEDFEQGCGHIQRCLSRRFIMECTTNQAHSGTTSIGTADEMNTHLEGFVMPFQTIPGRVYRATFWTYGTGGYVTSVEISANDTCPTDFFSQRWGYTIENRNAWVQRDAGPFVATGDMAYLRIRSQIGSFVEFYLDDIALFEGVPAGVPGAL